jgi:iron complex transport system ATP-binding protein
MHQAPILETRGVSYVAGTTTILDNVSWRIEHGAHWAVLGPNGSGKTTLLRIACGYLWPNAGGIVLRCGQPLVDLRQLRRSIGWISSTLNAEIPKTERVLDTVVSGRYAQVGLKRMIGSLPTNQDFDAAGHYLERLGCAELRGKRFGMLSQGEQQKVLVARALMAQPLLIILDEPCAGMDPGARERFLATLAEVAGGKDGPTLVLVTHHIQEIIPGLDNTLVLCQGRAVRSGRTTSVLDAATISEVYGVTVTRLVSQGGRLWPIWADLHHAR